MSPLFLNKTPEPAASARPPRIRGLPPPTRLTRCGALVTTGQVRADELDSVHSARLRLAALMAIPLVLVVMVWGMP
jgi:hypothetical protein